MNQRIEIVKQFIKENMGHEYEAHDYLHAFRVLKNGQDIIKQMLNSDECQQIDINQDVIYTACLVHDFVDQKLFTDIGIQIEKLVKLLEENQYTKDEIEEILYIINNISYSKGMIPNSLNGKIVQDADRLDALLSVGVLRPFTYGTKHDRPMYDDPLSSLSHYIEKKLKLEGMLNTQGARQICKDKAQITYIYLAYLLDELPDDIYEKHTFGKELEEFYQKYNDILPEFLRR